MEVDNQIDPEEIYNRILNGVLDIDYEIEELHSDREFLQTYHIEWIEFCERMLLIQETDGEEATIQQFTDLSGFNFENLDFIHHNSIFPPPPPPNLSVRADENIGNDFARFRFDFLTSPAAPGQMQRDINIGMVNSDQLDINRAVEVGIKGRMYRRGANMFYAGMIKYIEYLRMLRYPYQFFVNEEGQFFIRSPEEGIHNWNIRDFISIAAAIYICIQVGRKIAINYNLNPQEPFIFLESEGFPNRTRAELANHNHFPQVLRSLWTGVYELYTFRTHEMLMGLRPIILDLPLVGQRFAARKLDAIMQSTEHVQRQINLILGVNMFNIIYRNNDDQVIPSDFNNYLTNVNHIFTRRPVGPIVNLARLDDTQLDDFIREFTNSEEHEPVFSIREIYFRYAIFALEGRFNYNTLRQMAAHYSITGGADLQNYFRELVEFTNNILAEFAVTERGFRQLNNENNINEEQYFALFDNMDANNGIWGFDTSNEGIEIQTNHLYNLIFKTYIYLRQNVLANDRGRIASSNFLNHYMTRITGMRIEIEMRILNPQGQPIPGHHTQFYGHSINTGYDYRNQQNGVWPITLFLYFLNVISEFTNELVDFYQAYMNSFVYEIVKVSIIFKFANIAGGCSKGAKYINISGNRFRTYEVMNNNCFFYTISPMYELTMKKRLGVSIMRNIRSKVGLGKDDLISLEHIEKMQLPFVIEVLNGKNELIKRVVPITEPREMIQICYHENHYFTPIPIGYCEICKKNHRVDRKCTSKRDAYLKGEHKTFIQFSHKQHKEKQKDVNYIIADIETFPINGQHTPYAVAFYEELEVDYHRATMGLVFRQAELMENKLTMFEGPNCIEEAIYYLSTKKDCTVIFHNAAGYDNIIMMKTFLNMFDRDVAKLENVIYKNGKILSMDFKFKLPNDKISTISFWDSLLHLLGSLDSLCKEFKVPTDIAKGSFDHTLIKSWEDVEKYKKQWKPYLINDCKSLNFIVKEYVRIIKNELKLNPLNFITLSSMANHIIKKDICDQEFKIYVTKSSQIDEYIRGSIYGGRTTPIKQKFNSEGPEDYLVPLDVKSLYPYAMEKGAFFIGEPKLIDDPEIIEEIANEFMEGSGFLPPGIYRVRWTPPVYDKRFPIPFLPSRIGGNLLWQYVPHTGNYSSHMIIYAKRLGYTFDFLSGLIFPSQKYGVFERSNAIWQKMKYEAEIAGEKGKRYIAKIGNNSGYGKQIERKKFNNIIQCSREELPNIIAKYSDRKLEIFSTENTNNIMVLIPYDDDDFLGAPCHLGVVILDYSKIIMYDYFLKMMKPFGNYSIDEIYDFAPYYTDTDSIWIHKKHLHFFADVMGDRMGNLDYDIPKEFKVYYARFIAPKTYFFEAINAKGEKIEKQKTKGFPKSIVRFQDLKEYMISNRPIAYEWSGIKRDVFQKVRGKNTLSLQNVVYKKTLDFNCFKRCTIYEHNGQVYFIPFFEV